MKFFKRRSAKEPEIDIRDFITFKVTTPNSGLWEEFPDYRIKHLEDGDFEVTGGDKPMVFDRDFGTYRDMFEYYDSKQEDQ